MDKKGSFMPKKQELSKISLPSNALHISLVAIPEVMLSTLSSIYDLFNCFELLRTFDDALPDKNPFLPEIVSLSRDQIFTASGLPVSSQRSLEEVDRTDIIIIPSLLLNGGHWVTNRYPALVNWLSLMHERGAILCSACSGVLLLAETGLLNGFEATVHWAYVRTFRRNFPNVRLRVERVLVITGEKKEFVMSGASASWHDLVLYLIARHVGPTATQAVAKFMLLQWHADGQAPYVVFNVSTDHGDAVVIDAQEWLNDNYANPKPVEEMVKRSGIPERSFKRRFKIATGYSPLSYVQNLRIEEAKRQLERTGKPIDEISWSIGYEDPAFFRRLFKRIVRINPGVYRRKFLLPDFVIDSETIA